MSEKPKHTESKEPHRVIHAQFLSADFDDRTLTFRINPAEMRECAWTAGWILLDVTKITEATT